MGSLPCNINDPQYDPSVTISIGVECNKPVKQDLKHLLNWSLSEIRNIYSPFRKRKGSPLLTRSEFLRFINLSRTTSFCIFDQMAVNKNINIFQIISIVVLTAHTTYTYKLHFLFNIFDLDSKKQISFTELTLFFKSIVRGFCLLTDQTLPKDDPLSRYGYSMLSKADLNNDQLLSVSEIIAWMENCPENLALFKRFEPQIYGKQEYYIFTHFIPYTEQEIDQIHERIHKTYQNKKLVRADYQMLKNSQISRKSRQRFSSTNFLTNQKNGNFLTLRKDLGKCSINMTELSKKIQKQSRNTYSEKIKYFRKTAGCQKNSQKNSSHKDFSKNILIVNAKIVTKRQMFELRKYFDTFSQGKKFMSIQDFTQNFRNQKYSHMKNVAVSLFNFLDKGKQGKVQYMDLVMKLYPNLRKKHLEKIRSWNDEYSKNYNVDEKVKRISQQIKIRILPKTCIPRVQELFKMFDSENKGFITLENLKKILGNACSDKELSKLFQSCDTNKDQKLNLKQFVHVLLPSDIEIEGI